METPELAARPAAVLEHAFTAHAAAGSRARAAAGAAIVPLFASAMFLSGFLLFLVEPIVARMVLPILGGVPMVWNACVVFFQIVMLAGYGYAFGASRWLGLRRHVVLHAALLVSPALVLPFTIAAGSATPPEGNPIGWLLLLLAGSIGLPFFVLSTSASVFQHWLSRTDHRSARDPYFLYSASNLGCLLALASYPVLVEPALTLRDQTRVWTMGYAAFVALAVGCGVVAWRRLAVPSAACPPAAASSAIAAAPSAMRRARWVALAAVPSSLMLAVTSYISTDIASVPLLWILPLGLYLLTFSLAFGRHAAAAAAVARRALPLLVLPLALFMVAKVRAPLTPLVLLHLAAFTVMALNCHADLAKDRPDASRLTEFYFWVSFGGMLGGLFNALAAPVLFDSVAEYPLAMLGACLLFTAGDRAAHAAPRPTRERALGVALPLAVGALTTGVLVMLSAAGSLLVVQLAALSVPVIIAFTQRRHAIRFRTCMAALVLASLVFGDAAGRVMHATRTFFGVYRVTGDPTGRYHLLAHGTTLHGMQALAPDRRGEALTYYHETGPFGQAWWGVARGARGRDVAVVGLGVGTLAAYARPGQRWTFFEIDPAIERIARTTEYFTFMDACGDRCRVVIGDARVSLGRERAGAYDLLVLDAFSSDSIPVHLMTREALSVYLSRLAPDGAIVMHVSNRHLRLAPIVGRLAANARLVAVQQVETYRTGWPDGKGGSHWIALARTPSALGSLATDPRWTPLASSPSAPLWTDDFSNILGVLSIR
jgi:hypothetical protein